jgi:hypothetical protein
MNRIIVTGLAILYCIGLAAQSELPKEYPTVTDVVKKCKENFPKEGRKSKNGGGYSVSLKLLKEPPKKVALVTFFTFDPGLTKSYSFSTETSGSYVTTVTTTSVTKKRGASHGTASAIVDGFYYTSIDKLIALFKENGMELLLPEQFLDTDAKKKYYEQFEVQHDGFNDWMKNLQSGSHETMYAWPDGYKALDVVNEAFANYTKSGMLSTMDYKKNVSDGQPMFISFDDKKMFQTLGYDLPDALGVDAVLCVYFTIYMPKDSKIVLQNANMIMLGKNPIQINEGEKAPMFYRRGLLYCATRFQPDVPIYNYKKKDEKTKELDITGFDNVVLGLGTGICSYLKTGKIK